MTQPIFITASSQTLMHEDQTGYCFYHKVSHPASPPTLYSQLISNASSTIEIWDPYFNAAITPSDATIFASVKPMVSIKLLTQKGMRAGNPYLTEVATAIKAAILPSQNVRFGLRVVDKSNQGMVDWHFHDRMLIVDGTDFYLVGSSIGYHVTAQCSTGMFAVQDPVTQSFIRWLFDLYWAQAQNCEIPMKNVNLL